MSTNRIRSNHDGKLHEYLTDQGLPQDEIMALIEVFDMLFDASYDAGYEAGRNENLYHWQASYT